MCMELNEKFLGNDREKNFFAHSFWDIVLSGCIEAPTTEKVSDELKKNLNCLPKTIGFRFIRQEMLYLNALNGSFLCT